jgi:hypothetical protein
MGAVLPGVWWNGDFIRMPGEKASPELLSGITQALIARADKKKER